MITGKSRGNFIAVSGIIIAVLIAVVSWGVWKAASAPEPEMKPSVLGSAETPTIIGEERLIEQVETEIAQTVAENTAFKEETPSVPAAVAQSAEKGRWIYIDKAAYRLYFAEGNEVIKSWGIAVGKRAGQKQRVGDMTTPEGRFPIQNIQDARSWTHDFKDGKGVIKGAYGPWFIRLKTVTKLNGKDRTWTGIGIHGTHDPDSIGTKATEGCIRLRNEDVEELKSLVNVGMTVVIGPNGGE